MTTISTCYVTPKQFEKLRNALETLDLHNIDLNEYKGLITRLNALNPEIFAIVVRLFRENGLFNKRIEDLSEEERQIMLNNAARYLRMFSDTTNSNIHVRLLAVVRYIYMLKTYFPTFESNNPSPEGVGSIEQS